MFRIVVSSLKKTSRLAFMRAPSTQLMFKSITALQPKAWSSDLKEKGQKEVAHQQGLAERQPSQLNSVSNDTGNIVVVRGLPEPWNEKEISSYFDKDGKEIQKVNMIKNRIGGNTGKALITFKTKEQAEEFIKKWDHNLVDKDNFAQVIAAHHFHLKKREEVVHANPSNRKVYIYNLSFNTSNDDLYSFAADYGEVVNVELPTTANNKNKGFAYVTFKEAQDAQKFLNFAHEKELMGRKIRVQISSSRSEGKSTRVKTYSNFIFDKNQSEEDIIKGENLEENMKLFKEMMKEDAKALRTDKSLLDECKEEYKSSFKYKDTGADFDF